MLQTVLTILGDETNQKTLTWLGGGLVVAAGGVWTVVQFFWPTTKSSADKPVAEPQPPTGNQVMADRRGVAAGGNINIDNSTSTKAGVSGRSLVALVLGVLGAVLLATALLGRSVTASNCGAAAGGDIEGSKITIEACGEGK